MPRLVLKDGMERRRCNVACDSCRKRKEKCDSRQPCAGCVKRGIECVFAPPNQTSDAPPAKRRRSKVDQEHDTAIIDTVSIPEKLDTFFAQKNPRRWTNTVAFEASTFTQTGMPSPRSPSLNTSEVPVPHMPRLLREQHGSVVYVGGSASLSFLQNVQHIVFSAIGECDFVADPLLQSFLDVPSITRADPSFYERLGADGFRNGQLMLSMEQADMLAHQFVIATSGLLDLFDTPALFRSIQEWLASGTFNKLCCPVIYFVMAIGASVTATNGWDEVAERFFTTGRHIAQDRLTMEPSLDTVQAFVLMTMYMIGSTQPNAAFVTLGTAIRTAYALGLHRSDLQNTFSEPEKQSRERVWRSLRALDLFLSTALGRPCATSDYDRDLDSTDSLSVISDTSLNGNEIPAPAISSLCSIFERILTDVYKQQAVSIRVADEITGLYRQMSARLPTTYGNTLTTEGAFPATYADLAKRVAAVRVMSTYHWSIILLARPFLTAHVAGHTQRAKGSSTALISDSSPSTGSSIASFAEFGIDSAIHSLNIAADLLQLPGLPRRLPFVTESIFSSALTVGVAFFGDFDRSYALSEAMNKAQTLLSHLSAFDCQARRFQQFIASLANACKVFIERRDLSSIANRQMRKNSTFGVVGADSPTTSYSPSTFAAQSSLQSPTSPTFSNNKMASFDWPRANVVTTADPHAFPSPPGGDFQAGFNLADMVPTPPESRSDDTMHSAAILGQPDLEFLLRTSGAECLMPGQGLTMPSQQPYQNDFNLLTTDMGADVDILPMFDLLAEPILF